MSEREELRDETGAPERNPLPEEVAEGETETERNLEERKVAESADTDEGEDE